MFKLICFLACGVWFFTLGILLAFKICDVPLWLTLLPMTIFSLVLFVSSCHQLITAHRFSKRMEEMVQEAESLQAKIGEKTLQTKAIKRMKEIRDLDNERKEWRMKHEGQN